MRTQDLIASLAANTTPVPRTALQRRLLLAAALGTMVTLTGVIALYGVRPDLSSAIHESHFWIKAAFTCGLAAFGFFALERAARPGVRLNTRLALLAIPFMFILSAAVIELAHTPPADRVREWLGQTWLGCPFSIMALSLPPLALSLLALRRLAPTRPSAAGFSAGLLSGGLGAAMYGLHCPETASAFFATWYALGMLGSGAIGGIAGARMLRW